MKFSLKVYKKIALVFLSVVLADFQLSFLSCFILGLPASVFFCRPFLEVVLKIYFFNKSLLMRDNCWF